MRWLILLWCGVVQATTLSSLWNEHESLIVADKTGGKLYVYNHELRKVYSNPALYGKILTDTLDAKLLDTEKVAYITPSGEFTSTKAYSATMHEPITALILGTKSLIAIHPVWKGSPTQKRIERLNTDTPDDNRITNGCINILDDFYYNVIDKLKTGVKIIVLKEGDRLIDDVSIILMNTRVLKTTPMQYNVDAPVLDANAGLPGSAG